MSEDEESEDAAELLWCVGQLPETMPASNERLKRVEELCDRLERKWYGQASGTLAEPDCGYPQQIGLDGPRIRLLAHR